MNIVHSLDELRAALASLSGTVGFVPTMGALHEGHAELIRTSANECDHTVVSIFVNPLQFAPHEDFGNYPRTLDSDSAVCKRSGCTLLFVPNAEEIVGSGEALVRIGGPSAQFEGAIRPTHFDGVCTIVLKLFELVRPQFAYFGLKDLQQCAVISRLVQEFFLQLELRFVEVVREPDGLAMSSRNRYLEPRMREKASLIYAVLCRAAESIRNGSHIQESIDFGKDMLENAGFIVDYLELVNRSTMQQTKDLEGSRLIVAARLGSVRLIDNVPV